jgi:tRNA(Arg) A34 adenosine deaminase TadA
MAQKFAASRRRLLTGLLVVLPVSLCRRGSAAAAELPDVEQPDNPGDEAFIGRAFEMRNRAVEIGDQAYGAVVVRDGIIVGQSPSHVVVHRDPTAHAEMEAIRDAARRLGSRDLSNCTLYSSSPACPMCEAAAYWADIERLVYGVDARDGGSPRLCG